MNKKLELYINIFHKLTFKIGGFFKDLNKYNDRLELFEKEWIPIVKQARLSFLKDFVADEEFRDAYINYMDKEQDFILYVNANLSAPDQRKFSDMVDDVPFVVYWYQVVIWELYKKFSIAYYKSRDMGLSFGLLSGESMMLAHSKKSEAILMSRTEKEVDKTGDRTQTTMGRIRSIIENSAIYTLENFKDDKYLSLYKDDRVGVFGSATSQNAGSGNRVQRGFVDEAGKNPKLMELRQSLSMTAKVLTYAGTLKAGTDAGLRDSIKNSIEIDPLEVWKDFKEQYKKGISYKKSWSIVTEKLAEKIGGYKPITFKNTYRDHPLKKGDCDYREIECARLFYDPIAIAHELDADFNAPSPDRSLYNASKENIKSHDFFNEIDTSGLEWVVGFDPGTINTACIVPMLTDYANRLYVFPAEYMTAGTANSFIEQMAFKYKNMTLYPEESVKAYSNIGSGWWTLLKTYSEKFNFNLQISKNRNIDGMLLITNFCLNEKEYNPITNKIEKKILIHEKNEEWLFNYKAGLKRSGDAKQKEWSHAADAFIAAIYEINRKRTEFKNYNNYGAY